jgi:hypothetical protein
MVTIKIEELIVIDIRVKCKRFTTSHSFRRNRIHPKSGDMD